MSTACLGITIWSSTLQRSQTSSAVMILVVLAIRLFSLPFLSSSSRPLTQSSTTADRAELALHGTVRSRTAARKAATVPNTLCFIPFTRE